MKTSLCITTYNKPDALRKVLQHVARMLVLPDEVLICDDGSGEETAAMLKKVGLDYPVPLHHLWQEDSGWRVSAARNKGIREASGDYLLFLDGDCLPHPRWLKDHLSLAKPGKVICGDRVHVKEPYVDRFAYRFPGILSDVWKRRLAKRKEVFRNPWEKPEVISVEGLEALQLARVALGCNLGVWKRDAEAVHGFEEDIEGWNLEDIEFVARLISYGCEGFKVYRRAILFHLDHGNTDYDAPSALKRIEDVLATGRFRADRGLYPDASTR